MAVRIKKPEGRTPHDPDYGVGEHSIDGDRMGMVDEEQFAARLIKVFESSTYKPPRLPAVAMELMSLSQKSDVTFEAIESLLEQDPVLTGEVLSTARSTYYARTAPVNSLHDALVRLGLAKLRSIVFQAAMNLRVFRSESYGDSMERLRRHCQATAHIGRIISQHTPLTGEISFLCGLLHDVGIAGALIVLGDVDRGQKPPDLTMLWPAIHGVHDKAGGRMVELWGLPPEIVMAVGSHHTVSIGGFDHPFAATVAMAESLAAELGMGFVPSPSRRVKDEELAAVQATLESRIDKTDPTVTARAQKALALTGAVLDSIRDAAREWAETLTA